MCPILYRCTIFHFGKSKIFVPFISSGSNLLQFLAAYSLPSKRIRLFTPNFTLISCAHFRLKRSTLFPPIKLSKWPILTNQNTTSNFLYFCINLMLFKVFFSESYVTIATHSLFWCSQPLYIPLHFSFSSFQRRFMKRTGQKRSTQKSYFQGYPFLKEWKW